MSDDLTYDVRGAVAWFTINREAQRNAITPLAIERFLECLDQAETDDTIRVICLTGAGDKAFCSGADLSGAMTEGSAAFHNYAQLLARLAACPKPTVARVNGHCLAGGTGFMLACDIILAKEDAKFGTPEVNVGLFPMMIGALIFRNVPRKKAMEMILLGEKLTALEALEMGMLTRVVPAADLDREVAAVLEALAGKSPIGLKLGKSAFHRMENMPLEEALEYLSGQLGAVTATEDAKEGITAFIEKRNPVFKGK